MNYSLLKSRTFYSTVVLVAYNVFTTLVPIFPNVTWLSGAVDILGVVLVSYFHTQGIRNAALASAGGSPLSGQ